MEDTRPFPIQGHGHAEKPSTVPWWLAQVAYEGYAKLFPGSARSQSLERLAERGGFGREELVRLIRGLDE